MKIRKSPEIELIISKISWAFVNLMVGSSSPLSNDVVDVGIVEVDAAVDGVNPDIVDVILTWKLKRLNLAEVTITYLY